MNELERGRGRKGRLRLGPGRFGRGQADHGPNALPRLDRIPDGLLERAQLRRQREVAQVLLGEASKLLRVPHEHPPPPAAARWRAPSRSPVRSPPARTVPRSRPPRPASIRAGGAPPRAAGRAPPRARAPAPLRSHGLHEFTRLRPAAQTAEPAEPARPEGGIASDAAHGTRSRAIRPRMPFTSRAASSVAYRFASSTASLIATSGGTEPVSSSYVPIRSTLRSTAPNRSAVQPSAAAVIAASSSGARAETASARPRANSSTSPS